MLLRWWGCLTFVLSVILVLGSLLVLQRHSWPGQPTEVKSWAESQHTYLWERSRSHNYPGSTYAFYLDCGPPLEPLQQESWAVFHCDERASVGHWPGCIAQAWSIHTLALATGGPSIRVLSSPKRLRWAMEMFDFMFGDVAYRVRPNGTACTIADQHNTQFTGGVERMPTFLRPEMAFTLKETVYSRLGLKSHTSLPAKITLVSRKRSRKFLNEYQLATFLEQETRMPVAVVDFASISPAEQVVVMHGTGIFVGMHGAVFANSFFLPRGAVAIEVFPGRYYRSMYSLYVQSAGATMYTYHEPHVTNITFDVSERNLDVEVSLSSFSVLLTKATQAFHDNNQLYYRKRQPSSWQ